MSQFKGNVTLDGQIVSRVTGDLPESRQPTGGATSMSGVVFLPKNVVLEPRTVYHLDLDDGRSCDFFVTKLHVSGSGESTVAFEVDGDWKRD